MLSGAHALPPLWWNQSSPLLETSAATGRRGSRHASGLSPRNEQLQKKRLSLSASLCDNTATYIHLTINTCTSSFVSRTCAHEQNKRDSG